MSDIQKDAGAPARVLETTLRKLVAAISGEIGDRNLIAAAVLACTEAEKLKAEATKAPRLSLTVNQMLQAIEFATGSFHPDTEDELETSMTFSIGPLKDDDGQVIADGIHCWLTDLAGEGAIPLDEYPTEQDLAKAQAPNQAQADARDAWPKHGDLVRYASGATALALHGEPHASGWHGVQCMGGYTFYTKTQAPSAEDRVMWVKCAVRYRGRTMDEARIEAGLSPIAAIAAAKGD